MKGNAYGMHDVAKLLCENCEMWVALINSDESLSTDCLKSCVPTNKSCIRHKIYQNIWKKFGTKDEYTLDEIKKMV